MENRTPQDDKLIFVLDIGTRSVVGIAGHKEGDLFVVDAWAMENHPRRAMIDGQIEDIEQVALVAGLVKGKIEDKLGVSLSRVSVAAAGRALKTCRATAEMDLPATLPINAQTAYQLENAAVNEARAGLEGADTDVPYYCAGHSVVRYLLDDYPFTTIVDHRAAHAQVEIIATFLPAEVVESLRHCMGLLDLEIDTLTLEPIAAMRAVIPQDVRLLNLALVDIGAGTSDIALSAGGSVAGYTMATMAGDEVTEAIIRQYLVDFNTGEKMKLALSGNALEGYTDILGFEHELDVNEVLETIAPAVDTLAQVICDKILEINDGPPAAAFLVGGGSKTPGLGARLTEKMNLGANKVALAGTNFSGRLLNEDSGLDGPEFATPVGIALIACDNAENEGASVSINHQRVRLFTPASSSVMDALLIGGYQYSDLMGRNGRSLTFTLNGVRTVLRGGPYTAAELTVNGRPASLSTPVSSGDTITIVPATSGEDAAATIAKYAGGHPALTVTLNGTALLAGLISRVNGAVAAPDTPIFEQDDVEVYMVRTVGELCEAAGVETEGARITVNGVKTGPEHEMNNGDTILVKPMEGETPTPVVQPAEKPLPMPPKAVEAQPAPASELEPTPEPTPESESKLTPPQEPEPVPALEPTAKPQPEPEPAIGSQPEPVPESQPVAEPEPGPAPAAPSRGGSLRIQLNGKTVVLPPKAGGGTHQLFDMMALVDIDPTNPQGLVKVLLNGQQASYLEELVNGDVVEIGWEDR